MALISLQGACFDFGRKKILEQVNLSILDNVKYALVGANGAGKTTLLSLLAGELPPQRGTRQASSALRIRVLRQESVLDPNLQADPTLHAGVLGAAFAGELRIEQELQALADALASADPADRPGMIRRQGELQSEFERRDGYMLRPRLEATLQGIGLGPDHWWRPLSSLSGGERRRAALAVVLLAGGDVLLLDEPTNHLDLDSREWLEGFLTQFSGSVVMVSHDRHFLDRVASQTLHLEGGKLTAYPGNYTFFEQLRRQRRKQQLIAYQRQQEHIRRAEDFIRRNIAGQNTRQAQSRQRQLDRQEVLEKPSAEPSAGHLAFAPMRPSGRQVLEAHGLAKSYGPRVLFRGLDLVVTRGERLGIIGPNGCGKSSLLAILAGRKNPDEGAVSLGHNVDAGFYDQQLSSLSDHHTVIEELAAVDPGATIGQLRATLATFGFSAEHVDRHVRQLSGGERGRLALLRLVKEGHNTLLLDEPTNHLDLGGREVLEDVLAEFSGTLLVVSHDRRFLDRIVQRLLVFPVGEPAGRIQLFPGNYADYHRQQETDRLAAAQSRSGRSVRGRSQTAAPSGSGGDKDRSAGANQSGGDTGRIAGLSKNERARRLSWISTAEQEIGVLEKERDDLLAGMTAPDLTADRRRLMAERCVAVEKELAGKLALWERWHQEIGDADTPG